MASSGSFNTTGYATDYGTACLTFAWSIKSQSPATNQTVINWSVKGAGLDTGHYIKAGGFKVVINGQTVYSKSTDYRIELYTGTVVASGTATITHNTDGSKQFSASVEAGIYTYAVNCSGSGSWWLTTIPRYAKITTFKVASKTETTATITWGCDVACDKIQYSLNGGSWKDASGYPNFKITGLTYYTDYSVKIRVRRTDSQLTTDSSAISFRTYDYPHCIEAPKFVIGEPVSLGFFNPLGRTFTFSIVANGVTITHDDWTISGTSYYGLDDESIQTELYNSIPDREYASYYVKVTYGDSSRNYAVFDGYRVDPDKCRPIFSNFVYEDGEPVAVALTGDDQMLIKYQSILDVYINANDKMIALNGATPVSYTAEIEGAVELVEYSEDGVAVSFAPDFTAGVKRLWVTAYDSRGLSTTVYKDITVIDYDKPVINADIKRLNNFETQTTLKISGAYSRVTIDDTDKNSVTKATYRYREKGGEWSEEKPLTVTLMSGNYTCNDVVESFDNNKEFEVEIQITDKLDTTKLTATVGIGQAIFFISTNKKACYINGVEVPTLDTAYPIGSVYCSSTNTNPSEIYGGTWELIDKGFKAGYNLITQDSTTYLSTFRVASVRSGNTIRLRINVTTAQALSEDTVTLGTVDLAQHGLTKDEGGAFFLYTVYSGVSMSDGANAVILLYLTTGGLLQIADSFTSDGVHSLPAGTPFYFDVTLPLLPEQMADEFCNKFYWQRTA